MPPSPRHALSTGIATVAGGVACLVAAAVVGIPAAHAESVTLAAGDSVVVTMRGNGHGHGMSQYGARGAAIKGLSYAAILNFYYPHTSLFTLAQSTIRVRLAGTGTTTTVAAAAGMIVSGVPGVLATSGIARYRLIAGGGRGIVLQQLPSAAGSTWRTVRTGLRNGTGFVPRAGATVRVFDGNGGASTAYWGTAAALRASAVGTAGGVSTINRTSLDHYTAGVTPREMPASWPRSAVLAQAVAARSYGRYAVEHPAAGAYDICDTSSCQVYGGAARYDARGAVQWTEFAVAGTATSNQVVIYGGRTIFAQFSASDGGWSAAGGQPYLVAKQDVYDTAASGDPYLTVTEKVTGKSIATQFGLASLAGLTITSRDGAGAYGGRVLGATLTGRTAAGALRTVGVAGYQLQDALGSGTALFTVRRA